ncbi:MAG TPA: hypothetical protein VHX65_19565 [Pirellulales bacterium]|jgi:hypothetical protein|nr:hypothetical protein [Pirellulales bacterium]
MQSIRDRSANGDCRSAGFGIALSAVFLLCPTSHSASAADASLASNKPSDATELYKVQIVRPAKVGERFHMHREIERSLSESSAANGKPRTNESASMEINFSGTLEVMAVDKKHEPVKWKISAGTATIRQAGSTGHESLVKPGTEFTLSFGAGKATVADYETQHPLSEAAKKFLPIVFEATGGKGDASLGDMLDNPNASRTASWNIDTTAAVAALHSFDPKLKPSEVSGTARIKSVAGDGPKKTLIVQYEFKADSKKPANPPSGMTPVSATLNESGTVSLPADGSTGYFSAKALIHTSGTFKKTANKKESSRVGNRTVTKTVKVNEQTVIDEDEKVNTLITYEESGFGEKSEPSTSPSKSPSRSSSAADAASEK